MITSQQKGIVTLIKSAVDNQAYSLPEEFNFADAVKIAVRHKIVGLIYYGAVQCGIDRKCEQMQKLFRLLVSAMTATERQHQAHLQVMKAFEENGIEYMPLKGIVLQSLYPKMEMRTMGDADILIRMEQYDAIQNIMTSLGYEFDHEYYHELAWKRGDIEIELHKSMIPETSKDMYAYFGDGWKFARKSADSAVRYDLSSEECYIHTFAHLTKHYRGAGVGIKHMLDLWVYRRAYPQMDEQRIDRALEEMGLLKFHRNIMATIDVWFAEGKSTDITDHITSFIFANGVFGSSKNAKITTLLKASNSAGSIKKAKRQELWKKIFPSCGAMTDKYPVLRKVPVLLPVMWIVRWFQILVFKSEKVKQFLGKEDTPSLQAVEQRKQMYEAVGLDFSACENAE